MEEQARRANTVQKQLFLKKLKSYHCSVLVTLM